MTRSCSRASPARSAPCARSRTCRSRSPRASAAPSSAPTAPARPRCSTSSPATSRPPPAGCCFFGDDVTLHAAVRAHPRRACGAPTSPRSCSASSPCATTCSSPSRGVSRNRFSLFRARRSRTTGRALLARVRLHRGRRPAGVGALARPAAPARDRHGARRRAAPDPVRRAGGRALAGERAELVALPQRAAARTWASSSSSTISTSRCAWSSA